MRVNKIGMYFTFDQGPTSFLLITRVFITLFYPLVIYNSLSFVYTALLQVIYSDHEAEVL